MAHKYVKDGKELKLVFCYKNNPLYQEVRKRGSKCLVSGNKLYCLVNTMFIARAEGVEVLDDTTAFIKTTLESDILTPQQKEDFKRINNIKEVV